MDNSGEGYCRELLEKIQQLESQLRILREENDNVELLQFPWIGNLGNWQWYIKQNRVIHNRHKVLALGYTAEMIPEVVGFEFFTEKLHPDDYEPVMENMRKHLRGESPAYEVTYRIRTLDGGWKWFYDRGMLTQRDSDGNPEVMAGIVFDVTEQKQMEQRLIAQNEKLIELTHTDYLTGVYNRRALYDKLDYELRRVARNKIDLSLLMLDVDFFKKINDTHGHQVGDRVLVQVAEIMRGAVRGTDLIGRYGGEEFIVILPDCNLQGALVTAERIRSLVEAADFGDGLRVTVSGGVCQYHGESMDALINQADQAMYRAKQSGRNRIAAHEGSQVS